MKMSKKISKKIKGLLRNFVIFIVLLALGRLADNLPDALWCLAIQIGVYGVALLVGIRLITSVNRELGNNDQEEE